MKTSVKPLYRLIEIISVLFLFLWKAFVILHGSSEGVRKKRAVLFRKSLERLSSVFVKFGQLLALRPDFLPSEYCEELFYLLENIPVFSFKEVVKIFEEDFHCPPEKLFKTIKKKPIASASFGQVYDAILKTGERVAVKVQRPHIHELIKNDILLMKSIAYILDILLPGPNKLFPVIKEFEEWTHDELDYQLEAAYTQRYYQLTQDRLNDIITPKIYKKYSSSRILTTEFLEGVTLSTILFAFRKNDTKILRKLKEQGFSRKKFAKKLLKESIKEMFLQDFFHADPHPANMIYTDSKQLAYIDFGICGQITREMRLLCLRYSRSILYSDTENSFDALIKLCDMSEVTNMEGLKREHTKIVKNTLFLFEEGRKKGSPQVIGKKFFDTLHILQKYKAKIPVEVIRYFRGVSTRESVILHIDPQMELQEMATVWTNYSIISMLEELPKFFSGSMLNIRMLRLLNFLEKELLS